CCTPMRYCWHPEEKRGAETHRRLFKIEDELATRPSVSGKELKRGSADSAPAPPGTTYMSYIDLELPLSGGPALPRSTHRVINRQAALVRAVGAMIDTQASEGNGLLTGCAVAPYTHLVMAATALSRP